MKEDLSELLIAGCGPAGMAAAIYARRAGLSVIAVDRQYPGGQMLQTSEIANYPGLPETDGYSLAQTMQSQAEALGTHFITEEITSLELTPGTPVIKTNNGEYKGQAIILAMGARRKTLDIPGEHEFTGKGVSYCAACDGNFFKDKNVAVVGGGNTALEDAVYLSGLCNNVFLIHRRNAFRGGRILEDAVRAASNIVLKMNSTLSKIEGSTIVESITLSCNGYGEKLNVSGVFIAVGTGAESTLLKGKLPLDAQGRVLAGEDTKTSLKGIFVAGDLRAKPLYQIVTAAADGAVAATMAYHFLRQ